MTGMGSARAGFVVLRRCIGPDKLSPWGVWVVVGIVVLTDRPSNRELAAFRAPLNGFGFSASKFWRLVRV